MIKKIAAALSLLMVSGLAQAVVINFDELASGTVVNNVYAGVTFGTSGGDGEVRVYSACCSESDPNSIAPHPGGGFNFNADMSVTFAMAVNNLKFFIGGDNATTGSVGLIDIFDAGGLIATIQIIADGDGTGSTEELQDLSAYANVTGINIYNVIDPAGLVYDTFSYDVAVPEPGILALLGIGLFGMGLARRRRV